MSGQGKQIWQWVGAEKKKRMVCLIVFFFHVKDLGTTAWTAGVCEHKNPVFTAVAYDVPAVLSDIAVSLVSWIKSLYSVGV